LEAPGSSSTVTQNIGAVQVDYAALTLSGPDGTTSLEPKVMAVLQALAREAPSVVSRQALIDLVWGSESGGDESLSRAISLLRKALGDRRGQHTYIETIPRRGYRLVAPVQDSEIQAGAVEQSAVEQDLVPRPAPGSRRWGIIAAGMLLALALVLSISLFSGSEPSPMAALPERSVAVLPFSDLSPAGDQEYFADGLAEEILNALSRIPELKVAGRTSTFAYRGKGVDLRQLGAELGVSHVLEGSVRKDGDQVRITAQLIRTDNGFNSWSRSFDGNLERVFDFQEEIARDIASALEVTLNPAQSTRLAPALTSSQRAYDAFLQGRSLARRFDPDAKLRAVELLERAVHIDPQFALAWAELARTELFVPVSHPQLAKEPHVARAREAADRALAIDPDLAMGHFVRGLIQESELNYEDALQSFGEAHKLDPGNPFLTIRYGFYLALIGHTGRGIELMEQGLRLDPTDAAGITNLGLAKLALGELEEAERLLRRSYELGFMPVAGSLAMALELRGKSAEASEVWQESEGTLPGRYLPEFETAEGWKMLGDAFREDDPEARQWVAQTLIDYFAQPDSRANTYRLYLLVQAGKPAQAMRLFLDDPYPINAGFIHAIWLGTDDFNALLRHEDFPEFAQRIGLVAAWETYGWPPRCERITRLTDADPAFRCN
jgi:TolB-like protein/DNA-binding winged helix-turn-helix (wHTH) protein/Tfp pilus assembly protein PilF